MKTPRILAIFAAIVFAAACSQPDPRTAPVNASTPADFDAWRTSAAQKIPLAEMQEFDACVSEIRLGIMQRKEASGAGQIAQKLCEYINGKSMQEVLVLGYTTTIDWVSGELVLQRTNLQRTEEGLKKSESTSLRDYYNLVKDNIAKLEARQEKAKARLAELQAR